MIAYLCYFGIYGHRHSICVRVSAHSQREAHRIAWAYAERAFPGRWVKVAGVDVYEASRMAA